MVARSIRSGLNNFCHGYAIMSYAAQGQTVDVVLGSPSPAPSLTIKP